MCSVYGRSYNFYGDKTSDNSGTGETFFFLSETQRDLFSSFTASALREITPFAATSYEVTSTIDYTLMPIGLHQKK